MDSSPRSDKTNMLKNRQASVIIYNDNSDDFNNLDAMKIENLTDCVKITPAQSQELILKLKGLTDNTDRLICLDEEKAPYLFTSEVMMKIMDLTPSVKTKIAIITMLGPRLTDPKEKMNELVEIFRYAEEREKVSEVLKARTQTLNASIFKGRPLNTAAAKGVGGGRGSLVGRGLAGRPGAVAGRGFTPASSVKGFMSSPVSSQKNVLQEIEEEDDEKVDEKSAAAEQKVAQEISKSITDKRKTLEQQNQAATETAATTSTSTATTTTTATTKSTSTAISSQSTPSQQARSQQPSPVKSTTPPPNSNLNSNPSPTSMNNEKIISMTMASGMKNRSNENLSKLNSPEKQVTVNSNATELSIQAAAAIMTCMFPKANVSGGSGGDSKFDPESKFITLLGLNDDGSSGLLGSKEKWEYKSATDNVNVRSEISLILKALKMTSKEAASLIDADEWEKYLESHDVFVDEEHLKIEREILAVCRALGIPSFVAQRFSEKLENWEEKVVVEKLQKRDSEDHGVVLSAAKSKLYDNSNGNNSNNSNSNNSNSNNHHETAGNEDTPSNRSISDSFSVGTRSPTGSLDGVGSPPKIGVPVVTTFAARVDKYNRVKGLTNEEIIESLLRASREKRVTATLEKSTPDSVKRNDKEKRPSLPDVTVSNQLSNAFPPRRVTLVSSPKDLAKEAPLTQEINPGIVRQRSMTFNGGVVVNKPYDEKAAPAAFSLNMDTNSFLNMSPEEQVGFDEVNQIPLFSYKELVRRNHCKVFNGLQHRELEKYLTDEEFQVRFCMTKEQFKLLAKWRQVALKKALTLF